MLKPKEELAAIIEKNAIQMALDKEKQSNVIRYCQNKYKIEESIISDYLRGQKEISVAPVQILFILSDGIELGKKTLINKYFTESEISLWEKEIYQKEETVFPIRFKMLQVSDDAWIGPSSVSQLNKLYKQQFINYNGNTQRALKQFSTKDGEVYRPYVNKLAVNLIKQAYHEGRYIPNTITLNINPEDDDTQFYYNKENCELVINRIKMLDILDGYHRLLAMSSEILDNPDFDCPMELRITYYDINKARLFIYQEDQKTKMKKIDSDSYNVYSNENSICQKLNIDPLCDIQGMIGNNDALISQAWLGKIINAFWIKKQTNKEDAKKISFKILDALKKSFNMLVAYDQSYVNKKYSYIELISICYFADKIMQGEQITGELIFKMIQKIKDVNDVRLKEYKPITKSLMSYLEKTREGL